MSAYSAKSYDFSIDFTLFLPFTVSSPIPKKKERKIRNMYKSTEPFVYAAIFSTEIHHKEKEKAKHENEHKKREYDE